MSNLKKDKIVVVDKASKHPFQDATVINALVTGISHTLSEKCQLSCEFGKPFVEKHWLPIGDGTGIVELKSIQHNGFLRIHFRQQAIFKIMHRILGEPPSELNNSVLDGIGEITNIVFGTMQTTLNLKDYAFKMASLKAEFTKDLQPSTDSTKHLIVPFMLDGTECYIEIVLISTH